MKALISNVSRGARTGLRRTRFRRRRNDCQDCRRLCQGRLAVCGCRHQHLRREKDVAVALIQLQRRWGVGFGRRSSALRS